jgi:hypothetical protein
MTADPLAWTFGAAVPTEPGWYAVLQAWSSGIGETMAPSALRWQEAGWDWHGASAVIAWCGPFPSAAVADEWAQDHAPE